MKRAPLFSVLILTLILSVVLAAPMRTGGRALADEPVRLIVRVAGSSVPLQWLSEDPDGVRGQNWLASLAAQRADALQTLRLSGVQPQAVSEFGGAVFNGLALTVSGSQVDEVEALLGAAQVYPDAPVYATLGSSVPRIGADQVWTMGDGLGQTIKGRGVRVAIIDTGVDYLHNDLGGCLGPGCKVIGGANFIDEGAPPLDDNGHGTHVAGIVAASGAVQGVAPDAQLLAYKALNSTGMGYMSDVIAAIDQAVLDGADIINLSLGGKGSPKDPVSQAVDSAVRQGVFVVAAAGNDGRLGYGTVLSPGVARLAFTVASADIFDGQAATSSKGPVKDVYDLNKPDLTAPGVSILSTYSRNGGSAGSLRMSGTSMAAPHVAGAAALLLQLHPEWTPDMLRSALTITARDLGSSLAVQGAGRLQVAEAARQTLLASPASLALGPVESSGEASIRLTNTGVETLSVIATVSARRSMVNEFTPVELVELTPVEWAALDLPAFSVEAGDVQEVRLKVNPSELAAPGIYEGAILLSVTRSGSQTSIRLPFSFLRTPLPEFALPTSAPKFPPLPPSTPAPAPGKPPVLFLPLLYN